MAEGALHRASQTKVAAANVTIVTIVLEIERWTRACKDRVPTDKLANRRHVYSALRLGYQATIWLWVLVQTLVSECSHDSSSFSLPSLNTARQIDLNQNDDPKVKGR